MARPVRQKLVVAEMPAQAVLRPVKEPLYDTTIYPAAGALLLQFFTIPFGQAMPVTAVLKTLADTNLQQASQIGTPNKFELYGFKFKYQQTTTIANNFAGIYDTGVFTFNMGQQRPLLQIPLSKIPCGCMPNGFNTIDGAAAPGVTIQTLTNGPSATNSYYNFTVERQPIEIGSTELFGCNVQYPLGVIAVNANTRIQCFMVGIHHRAI